MNMWVVLNDAFFSIVQNRDDKDQFVVRARFEGDIEKVFDVDAIVSENSDYRFRAFLPKSVVKEMLNQEVDRIDYDNFKNSVDDDVRHDVYTGIWAVLFNFQQSMFPKQKQRWSLDYD